MAHYTYLISLGINIVVIVWIASALHRKGRAFLADSLAGNETGAASLSHLLTIGLYLVTLSYVLLTLRYDFRPTSMAHLLQTMSVKIGWLLLVLAAANYMNLWLLTKVRARAGSADGFRNAQKR